jgi:hypothetical protein
MIHCGSQSFPGTARPNGYVRETVNSVESAFAVDARDKDSARAVTYDARRTSTVYLFATLIAHIEACKDVKDGCERSVITLSSGLRYSGWRGAAVICKELAKSV